MGATRLDLRDRGAEDRSVIDLLRNVVAAVLRFFAPRAVVAAENLLLRHQLIVLRRATFVTIALAAGKTETWVSDRTGHDGHTMIEKYRRKARTWNLGELGPFYALIPELAEAKQTVRITPRLPLKLTARVAKQADAADLGSPRRQGKTRRPWSFR